MAGAFAGYLANAGSLHYWAIEMGGNDAWGGGPEGVPNFAANLSRFVDSARAHGIEPILARPTATDSSVAGWQVDPGDAATLIALLVCLIPTTIGALLAAIGIAGMDRALQANIIAKSGKAVEMAGDVDVVLLDKTGTITIGNRNATTFLPLAG